MSTDSPSESPGQSTIPLTAKCRAVVQEGPRKGASCQFPAQPDGYCGRHKRNKEYDEGITAGKRWCRFFFRCCSSTLTIDDPHTACDACRAAKSPADPCKHEGCRNKQKPESEYCGKHQRDALRATGVRYCDIARGCLNVCEEDFATCADCREKQRVADTAKRQERRATHTHDAATPKCVCCGKEYTPIQTAHKKKSTKCTACNDQQKKQDERRKGRVRHYNQERFKHPATHYEMYKRRSVIRGISFNLTLEQFKEIVVQPCFYCGHHVEEEAIGIDRFNNSLPYDLSNCKPCCEPCNIIKYTYHPRFFVEKCKAIIDSSSVPINLAVKWPEYYSRSVGIQFSKYQASAKKRHLQFELTEEQFHWFINHPCSYCRQEGPCGLDRRDNALGYTATNVQACCMTCNMMRKDHSIEVFIEHVRKVAAFWPDYRMTFIDTDFSDVAHTRTRTTWKAASLYLAIMSNTDSQFKEQYADSIDAVKYAEIRAFAVSNTKGVAIARIRTFLATLKKRRYRHAAKHTVDESQIDHV